MGIRFHCPNGHKLNVKSFLRGRRGICPHCKVKVDIPDVPGDSDEGDDVSSPSLHVPAHALAAAATPAPTAVPVTAVRPVGATLPTVPTPVTVVPAPGPAAVVAPVTFAPVAAAPAVMATVGTAAVAPMAGLVVAGVRPANPVAAIAPQVGPPGMAAPVPPPAPPGGDPLLEAPNAAWFVRPPAGGQFGPANGELMRRWIGEGRVTADSHVWREGWPDWRLASESLATHFGNTLALGETKRATTPYAVRRRNNNTTALVAIVFLTLLVIILGVVFVIIMMQQTPTVIETVVEPS